MKRKLTITIEYYEEMEDIQLAEEHGLEKTISMFQEGYTKCELECNGVRGFWTVSEEES